jgi:hypothetical protein
VLHDLTSDLNAKRVEISRQLLEEFNIQEQAGFDIFIIRDELWFFSECSPGHVWQLVDDYVSDYASRKSGTEKHMLTIFWGRHGPLVIE